MFQALENDYAVLAAQAVENLRLTKINSQVASEVYDNVVLVADDLGFIVELASCRKTGTNTDWEQDDYMTFAISFVAKNKKFSFPKTRDGAKKKSRIVEETFASLPNVKSCRVNPYFLEDEKLVINITVERAEDN